MRCEELKPVVRFMAVLILILFAWNIAITSYIVIQTMQVKEDKFNQQVCIEELVPMETIEE